MPVAWLDTSIVVGSSYERVVLDSVRDVLLLFHAPWCGACKAASLVHAELSRSGSAH